MGVIQRQGIKQSLATYVGVLIGVVNLLYIYPKFITPEELGLVQFVKETAMMIAPLIFLGSNTIIIRYFPHFKDATRKHNGFLFFLCAILGVGFLVFLTLSLIFQKQITEYYASENELFGPVLPYIIPLVFLVAYAQLFTSYASNFKRIVIPNIFNDLFVKIGLPALVLCFAFEIITFNQIFLGLILVYTAVLLGQIGYLRYLGQFYLKPSFSHFTKPLLKEMGGYGLYGILGSLGSRLASGIDIFMLASLSTLDNTGIYVIPLFISNVIDIPRKAIGRITSPIVAEKWKEGKIEEIKGLYKKTSLNQLIVGLWFLIGIWLSIDDLFSIIPRGDQYALGKYVVLFLGAARVVDMMTGVNSEIIGYSKYFKFNFYLILCLAVFNVVINYLLIPIFDYNGAALATLISMAIFNLMKFIVLKWKLNMQPFTWQTLGVLAIGLVAYLVTASYVPLTDWALVNMAIKSVLMTVIFFGGIFYFKLSEELLALFKNGLETIKSKLG
jgi:O-antigen/teichoic acid export membrane protein